MPPPAAAVPRRAVYDHDHDDHDDPPPGYHEPEAQQKPPEYRYPLSHKLLWWAFVAAMLGFCAASVGAVATQLEAVGAARRLFPDPKRSFVTSGPLEAEGAVKQDESGSVYDWAGGGSKGLWMQHLPKNLVDDLPGLHVAANALTVAASGAVLVEFLGRCGCVGSRVPPFLHGLIISLVAAAAGLSMAAQAYAAGRLAASSTFDLEVARAISKTTPSVSEYRVEIQYSEGTFALESWACQLKDFKTLWGTRAWDKFDGDYRLRDVCLTSRSYRHWSIAAGVLAVVMLAVLVVDWRFQFFVKRRVEDKTAGGDVALQERPRPTLP